LDLSSGKELWRFKFSSLQGGYFHPLVGRNEVVFGSQDSCFYALDSNSGETLWKFPVERIGGSNAVWINGQLILRISNKLLIVE
jgi:outer membrane protein assembly factor BamB